MAQSNNSANSSRNSSPPHTPLSRSRSNSILKGIMDSPALHHLQQQQALRRATTSDNILSRLPSLHHDDAYQLSEVCSNKPEDYLLKEAIGYGSSAVVYEGTYKPTNTKVAIKVIDLDMFERNQIDELRRETALMALSKHPNVLRVLGSYIVGSKLHIITPFLSGGSCLDIMKTSFPDGFEEIAIATILKQALEGLIYIHKNGHIHRDVKAGNLLMDDCGGVQLADFGVSSSLTENNEVRKTFVGTPCWMAPEVMEQNGYDYKADIWSFGITTIELATGHAPFAKYPPMKVLMMTLSQDPPTLNIKNTKHKFSKLIKDMVDVCLQKDPKKRPTADKLLLHPFFKQAKKKEYLVKTILLHVPNLNNRTHKKLPHKHITFESTDQWDFDDTSHNDNDNNNSKDEKQKKLPAAITTDFNVISNSGTNTPVTAKKHISFGDVVIKNSSTPILNNSNNTISYNNQKPTSTTEIPSVKLTSPDIMLPTPQQQKKSRFVVSDTQGDQLSTTHSQQSISSLHESAPPHLSEVLFNINPTSTPLSTSSASSSDKEILSGVGLGISGHGGGASSSHLTSIVTSSLPNSPAILSSNQEVKKGRFSVNQTTPLRSMANNTSILDPNHHPNNVDATHLGITIAPELQDYRSTPVSRIGSNDSLRKSRFAVQHSPIAPLEKSIMEASSTSSLSRNSSLCNKPSRFSIEKEENNNATVTSIPITSSSSSTSIKNNHSHHSHPHTMEAPMSRESSVLSYESASSNIPPPTSSTSSNTMEGRKKSRFQVSGLNEIKTNKDYINGAGGSYYESPQSSISSNYSPNSSFSRGQSVKLFDPSLIYSQVETLYKQVEIQRLVLQDLMSSLTPFHQAQQHNPPPLSLPLHGSTSTPSKLNHLDNIKMSDPYTRNRSHSINSDIINTLDHLQHLVQATNREKDKVLRENESLKYEIEKLKKLNIANHPSSGSTHEPLPLKSTTTTIESSSSPYVVVDPLPPSEVACTTCNKNNGLNIDLTSSPTDILPQTMNNDFNNHNNDISSLELSKQQETSKVTPTNTNTITATNNNNASNNHHCKSLASILPTPSSSNTCTTTTIPDAQEAFINDHHT